MMDPVNSLPADRLDDVHQNGVHDKPSNSGEDGVSNYLDPHVTVNTETFVPDGNSENINQLESTATGNSAMKEIEGSNDNLDDNNLTVSKVWWFCFSWVGFTKSVIWLGSNIFALF